MTIKRPILIKNLLVEAGLSPGKETQSLTKQQLEKLIVVMVDQKNTINKLKDEMSILICKENGSNERIEGSQESNGL